MVWELFRIVLGRNSEFLGLGKTKNKNRNQRNQRNTIRKIDKLSGRENDIYSFRGIDFHGLGIVFIGFGELCFDVSSMVLRCFFDALACEFELFRYVFDVFLCFLNLNHKKNV
jgi:hypothetical protein